MSSGNQPKTIHFIGLIALSLLGLISFFFALSELPEWFGSVDSEASGVLMAFDVPLAVAIVCLTFPLLQVFAAFGFRAWREFELNYPKLASGVAVDSRMRMVILYPMIIGLQLLYVWLLFGAVLAWLPIMIIVLGSLVLRAAANF